MSPEQLRGESLDARSDLFSLGAVLHELLSGARAFPGSSFVESGYAILHNDPTPLPPELPTQVTQVVLRCLEKEPGRRFQSASDSAFALEVCGEAPIRGRGDAARSPSLAAVAARRRGPARPGVRRRFHRLVPHTPLGPGLTSHGRAGHLPVGGGPGGPIRTGRPGILQRDVRGSTGGGLHPPRGKRHVAATGALVRAAPSRLGHGRAGRAPRPQVLCAVHRARNARPGSRGRRNPARGGRGRRVRRLVTGRRARSGDRPGHHPHPGVPTRKGPLQDRGMAQRPPRLAPRRPHRLRPPPHLRRQHGRGDGGRSARQDKDADARSFRRSRASRGLLRTWRSGSRRESSSAICSRRSTSREGCGTSTGRPPTFTWMTSPQTAASS